MKLHVYKKYFLTYLLKENGYKKPPIFDDEQISLIQ